MRRTILDRVYPAVVALTVLAVGAGLIATSVALFRGQDRWAAELRGHGEQVNAQVTAVDTVRNKSGTVRYIASLRYRYEGRVYTGDVNCMHDCPRRGMVVRVWLAPGDLTDFVTEWGILSGEDRQDLPGTLGIGGGLVVLAAVGGTAHFARERRRARRAAPAPADLDELRRRRRPPPPEPVEEPPTFTIRVDGEKRWIEWS